MSSTPVSERKRALGNRMMHRTAGDRSSDILADDSDHNMTDTESLDDNTDDSSQLHDNRSPTSVSRLSASPSDKACESFSSNSGIGIDRSTSPKSLLDHKVTKPMPTSAVSRRSPRVTASTSSSVQSSSATITTSSPSYSFSTTSMRLTRQALHKHSEQSQAFRASRIKDTRPYTSLQKTSMSAETATSDRLSGTCQTSVMPVPLLLVLVIIAVMLGYYYLKSPTKITGITSSRSCSTIDAFLQAFENITDSFSSQVPHLWKTLRAGTRPIMQQDDPVHPAVFLIVIPSDAMPTGECLIRWFADAVTHAFDAAAPAVRFMPDSINVSPPEHVKRQLDDTLRGGLSAGSRVAVVDHMERLHGESAMMLHAYCDNEHAPFRRAVFILALHIAEATADITETDAFVEAELGKLWEKVLGSNRFHPLLSRIGNSIAFIRRENLDVLRQNKCTV